jgi:hypothetical protein
MIYLLETMGIQTNLDFANKWCERISFINTQMKSIQKIQHECDLLNLCANNSDVLNKIYDGICVEADAANGKYSIYLPDLKRIMVWKCKDTENQLHKSNTYKFRLYWFENKAQWKQKIRIGKIDL